MVGQGGWENAAAGSIAGFATVAIMHPLDVVRTRFQGHITFLLLFIIFCCLFVIFGFVLNKCDLFCS